MLGVGLGLTQPRGRAGGFSPADIAGLAGWWDASDTATITESGGAVSQVDDKSGNGLHLTEPTEARQPSTGASTVNGLNALRHETDDFMFTATDYSAVSGEGFTMVGVMSHISDGFCVFGTNLSNIFAYPGADGNASTGIIGGFTDNVLRVDGQIESPVTRGDVYNLAAGKVSVITFQAKWSATASRGIVPLNYRFDFGLNPVMDWCEAVFYDSEISAGDLSAVESYLAGKWGVTLA